MGKKYERLRDEKGSITLFILLSVLFFLVIVVSVFVYVQNKQSAMDREYNKIKNSYEQDIGNEGEIYTEQVNY